MPVATGALRITGAHARSIRNPMSEREYARITEQRRYVVNITEKAWQVQRTFGVFQIAGCLKGQPYTVLEVTGRVEVSDEGDDRGLQISHEADEIAADVAREINENITAAPNGIPFMGVFVSESKKPAAEELAAAREKLREYQRALVAFAVVLWDDPKTHREINELHRWAGRALNVTGDWLMPVYEKVPCAACGTAIKPGLAKCPECHAVLDLEKMKEFFPLEYLQIVESQKPAKRPKAGAIA
jgi:hypothetical protein